MCCRLYYQGREDRVASCPSTIHTWLHVPQDIINAGPSWLSWAFPMEREVQWAKAGVKDAKKQPFAHMAGRALRREQIKHLGHRLGISRQLDVDQRLKDSKDGSLGPKREVQEMGCKCLRLKHRDDETYMTKTKTLCCALLASSLSSSEKTTDS